MDLSAVENASIINENIANSLVKYVEDRKGMLSVDHRNK